MHGKVKTFALVICSVCFLIPNPWKWSAPRSGRGIYRCPMWYCPCNLRFQLLAESSLSRRDCAGRKPPPRSFPCASGHEISSASARTAHPWFLPVEPLWVVLTRDPLAAAEFPQ